MLRVVGVVKRLAEEAVVDNVPPLTAIFPAVVIKPFDPVMEKLVAVTSLAPSDRALPIEASERSMAVVIPPAPEDVMAIPVATGRLVSALSTRII
jgi:hypothetical protein